MQDSVAQPYTPGPFSDLLYFVYDLGPGWIVLVSLLFAAVGLWIAYRTLPLYYTLRALKSAPVVAIDSGEPGLVRVAGHAYSGQPVLDSYAAPTFVWRETSKLDTRSSPSMSRTGTYSVAMMLVRDERAECLIDPKHARVLPSRKEGEVDHHFGGDATYRTVRMIEVGDPVFAIGVLGKAKRRTGQGELARCTLRPSRSGVLVLSGQSEARTQLYFQARYWPRAAAAFLCVVCGIWILKENVMLYPTNAAFLQQLIAQPWANGVAQRLIEEQGR
jgi:hypothetical protein